jgi:hypothetical protein
MSKSTLLSLLLISAICTLVNIFAGWVLVDLGSVASIVLSIIFLANVRKFFGPEAESARKSCLWNVIVNSAVMVLGGFFCLVLAVLTLGIGLILLPVFQGIICALNIGFGVWQIVAWNKLNNLTKTPPVSV